MVIKVIGAHDVPAAVQRVRERLERVMVVKVIVAHQSDVSYIIQEYNSCDHRVLIIKWVTTFFQPEGGI